MAALPNWRTALGLPPVPIGTAPVVAAAASAGSGAHLGVYARSFAPDAASGFVLRRMPATAAQTAQELFAVLRALDDAGVQEIWVERVPVTPDWAGVADRLQRASA
jgi:L-threonylcarbamoyladenylate synthase